jgi:hypothetical protein
MRLRSWKVRWLARASRITSRRVCSPATGKITSRTVPSGRPVAAVAILTSMASLPRMRVHSPNSSRSTRVSARVSILWTSPSSRSTRPSTSSAVRTQHSAASKVSRIGRGASRKSEGYMRAARARQAARSFSAASANSSAGSPRSRIRPSLPISVSMVSSPSRPGSALSSASTPGPAATRSSSSSTSSSSLATVAAGSRSTVRAQNACSEAARALPRIRSIRLGPGGSIRSARQRASNASRSRSSPSSVGQTSSASQTASLSSSPTVTSRKPSSVRICARCRSIDRPVQS